MDAKRLGILLERLKAGTCSDKELAEIDAYYYSLDDDTFLKLPSFIEDDPEGYVENRLQLLEKQIAEQQQKRKIHKIGWLKIAAAIIIFFGISTGLVYYLNPSFLSHVKQLPAAISYNTVGQSDVNSRYLKLPDSSIVILHAGSSLQLLDSNFSGAAREVALTGEAYFDIRHMADKPFIIHTGKVKVTVLGTAFNVRQNNDSVAVTVTQGKVMVEDKHKVLAVLTPNQQIVYHEVQQQATRRNAPVELETRWIKAGLNFNDESLASVARKLEERYGVHISFTNNEVAKCRIAVTAPFSGMESINDILSFICPIVNATYKEAGGNYVIDGKGCN